MISTYVYKVIYKAADNGTLIGKKYNILKIKKDYFTDFVEDNVISLLKYIANGL